jgi:hypothetical protein
MAMGGDERWLADVGASSAGGSAMPLARLYDLHAEECDRAAEEAEDPGRRALLINLAREWREAAQALRQSPQPNAARTTPLPLPQRRKKGPAKGPRSE